MFKLLRKRLFRTKKNKGFTLTELIVVVALIAILMACVVAFASPVRQVIAGSTAKADSLTINEIMGTYIERKLSYASRIDVCSGVTYNNSDSTLIGLFNDLKGYKDGEGADKNSPGMMVFRFEYGGKPDGTADADKNYSNTFKIYNVRIAKSASPGGDPENVAYSLPNLSDPAEAEKYLVFSDDFCSKYKYLITSEDTTKNINKQKRKAYLNFKIQSLQIDESEPTFGLTANDIDAYYQHLDAPGSDDPMNKFTGFITGAENVSFSLQNISYKSNHKLNDNGTPGDETDDFIETSLDLMPFSHYEIKHECPPGGKYGTDVVIFYNVRKYDVSDWKTT